MDTGSRKQFYFQHKKALALPPVLCHADPKLPFIVEPDASNYAIGAVLKQEHQVKATSKCVPFL